jgi:hypothetical protein
VRVVAELEHVQVVVVKDRVLLVVQQQFKYLMLTNLQRLLPTQ